MIFIHTILQYYNRLNSQNQYYYAYGTVLKTRYDFEIKNDLGTIQGSVTLVIEDEYITQQEAADVVEQTNSLESNPIGQEKLRDYVAGLHMLNDKAFEIQYKVY